MIRGEFSKNTPLISVTLGWGNFLKEYVFILDTGFTGDLQITEIYAKELGITPNSLGNIIIANGEEVTVPQSLAFAVMEEDANSVQVGISSGSPLAGINFLTKFGYKAIVDCKNRSVALEKA